MVDKHVLNDQRRLPRRVVYCPVPDDGVSNASYAFTYNTDDNVETITKTVGTDSWVKTLTYTGTNLTAISVWV